MRHSTTTSHTATRPFTARRGGSTSRSSMGRRRVASPEEPTPRACRRARRHLLRDLWLRYECRPPSHPCPSLAVAKAVWREAPAPPARPTQPRGSSPPLPIHASPTIATPSSPHPNPPPL